LRSPPSRLVLIKLSCLSLVLFPVLLTNISILNLLQNINKSVFLLISPIILPSFVLHQGNLQSPKEHILSIVWFFSGIFLLLGNSDISPKQNLFNLILSVISTTIIFNVIRLSKILINKVETARLLRNSNHHLGPGLARSFFGFLKLLAPDIDEVLTSYQDDEAIEYIHQKVFIIFPKKTSFKDGSIQWMFDLQRKNNPSWTSSTDDHLEFTLVRSMHEPYTLNGRRRHKDLAVIKIRDRKNKKVFYVAIAENRPLLKLQEMARHCCFNLSKEEFELQVEIYRNSLIKLIKEDSKCFNRFEIIDLQAKNHEDFQIKIYEQIRKSQ